MAKQKAKKITIEKNGKYYPIFNVGYSSDGGFFLIDLIGGGDYLVGKARLKMAWQNKLGSLTAPMWDTRFTTKHPKLSHHLDGSVQISGEGIVSGFFPLTRRAKAVSTKSFNLIDCNHDGGPQVGFCVWGLEKLTKPSDNPGDVCISTEVQFDNHLCPPKDNPCFVVEAFYYPKKLLPTYLEAGRHTFRYKNLGIVPMIFVPSPEHSPGVLGLVCYRMDRGSNRVSSGFITSGGTGRISCKEFEQLFIMFPANEMVGEEKVKSAKTIDFSGRTREKIIRRDKVEGWIKKIFKRTGLE